MSEYLNVTTQSGARRHLALPSVGFTLCHFQTVGPDRARQRNALTQAAIDRLPLCKQCARAAAVPPPFAPRPEVIVFPWHTWVTARRRARTHGQRFDDYIFALIDADIATDAHPPLAADEADELWTRWGAR